MLGGPIAQSERVPLLEAELPSPATLLALVDGQGRVLVRAGRPPGGDAVVDFSLRAGRNGAPVYYQPQARMVAVGGRRA